MKNLLKKLKNREGFTLAELLIVVAIIAVLVAISIPVFTSQLEKAREATDLANIRAAYAEVMVKALDNPEDDTISESYTLQQNVDDWTTTTAADTLEKLAGDSTYVTGNVTAKGTATITWVPATTGVDGHVKIEFS